MVARFRSRLIADIDGGLPYTLWAAFSYDSAQLNRTITVPSGFKTDLASIPRALWWWLPPMGNYTDAAVIHDFLYVTGGMDRGDADAVLNEAMECCGVGRWTRWTIVAGVRLGGWLPWKHYRDADAAKAKT